MQKKLLLAGAAAGAVCGIFGAGGGMILVPLLIRFCGIEPRKAFATSLAVMLPISAVSLAVLFLREGLALRESLPYAAGGVIGGIAAGFCLQKIPTRVLHRIMGALILWGGVRLLWS